MNLLVVVFAPLIVIAALLSACNGGQNSTNQNTSDLTPGTGNSEGSGNSELSGLGNEPAVLAPVTPADASRFLAQATFGPTQDAIAALSASSYSDWINNQFALPEQSVAESFAAEQAIDPNAAPSRDWVFEGFWRLAVTAEDQLRQRMAFALSQIFVISLRDGAVAGSPDGVADFYSLLGRHAFGNFRVLLEEVTLHPMMGRYLSHLGNAKGDEASGRVPDENFAREIMQLFTIGLYQLNSDGSLVVDDSGLPIETYATSDVQGLAKVFTGFSWNGPDKSLGRFQGWIPAPERTTQLMQAYPEYHSTREKRFLDQVIGAQQTSDPEGDLAMALDTLFNHPNVGPFIGKQLIQRLVSSNPSAAYVERVSAAFNDNGNGERGDMRALLRAILLDPEARDVSLSTQAGSGRIREPILRAAHWMRSFNAVSVTGKYRVWGTDDPATSLSMTVLRSPSVFNFYRPGYVPPNTPIAEAGLVSPEMQITHETSVAGYLNSMLGATWLGTGFLNDVISDYPVAVALADRPKELLSHLDLLLLHGSMSASLRERVRQIINLVRIEPVEAANADNTETRDLALLERTRLAVYSVMAAPEYSVLK